MKSRELITITEYARLRGVTTETLRHYDRIGLLKPAYIDPKTNLRYYSLSIQKEKLGTILELKQLGMSLHEIEEFLRERNFAKSLKTLREKQLELETKIRSLTKLNAALGDRIENMERIHQNNFNTEEFKIRQIGRREMLVSQLVNANEYSVNLSTIMLETKLKTTAPIIGYSRFALLFAEKSWLKEWPDVQCRVGIIVDEGDVDKNDAFIIEGGLYVCKYGHGHKLNISEEISSIEDYCVRNKYEIAGDVIELITIDMGVTDVPEETIYELQVPVRIK